MKIYVHYRILPIKRSWFNEKSFSYYFSVFPNMKSLLIRVESFKTLLFSFVINVFTWKRIFHRDWCDFNWWLICLDISIWKISSLNPLRNVKKGKKHWMRLLRKVLKSWYLRSRMKYLKICCIWRKNRRVLKEKKIECYHGIGEKIESASEIGSLQLPKNEI